MTSWTWSHEKGAELQASIFGTTVGRCEPWKHVELWPGPYDMTGDIV